MNGWKFRDRVCSGLDDNFSEVGITATIERYGTVSMTDFMADTSTDYVDILENDVETYMDYRWEMIDCGVMMVPTKARRNYITAANDDDDVRRPIEAADAGLRTLSR